MRKRLSSEDFLKRVEELWQAGPKVKYQNPSAWIAFLEGAAFSLQPVKLAATITAPHNISIRFITQLPRSTP